MKQQLVKGFSMLILTLAVAFGMAMVSVNAQSTHLSAQVPFDFVVGNTTLPAGKYTVNAANPDGSALCIRNAEAKGAAIRLTNTIEPNRNKTESRLVFHRYGQTYFLAEVWRGGAIGRQLFQSKRERAMKSELGKIAENRYQTVELVAVLY